MEININTIEKIESGINPPNDHCYRILKPTLFVLRFIGGPTGLWRHGSKKKFFPEKLSKYAAFLLLISINGGIVVDCVFTYLETIRPDREFNNNLNLFFALTLCMTGAVGLDILWWKRKLLRELLVEIDVEPQVGEVHDSALNLCKIRKKIFKMYAFMAIFVTFANYSFFDSTEKSKADFLSSGNHKARFLFVIRCIAVFVFAIILSLYISLTWVFRLKVRKVIKHVKLLRDSNQLPNRNETQLIEIWFNNYVKQFRKYELSFKQIAGLIYIVIFWSIMSLAEQCIVALMSQQWTQNTEDWIQESLNSALLTYFLYCTSSIDHSLRKLVKILYQIALKINSQEDSKSRLSQRVSQ
jgi:hypothetical protein